ncbi:hypothetical protein AB837_00108 [bacterium AB1]|nr:hypothetical protein AB837_00108 [bacterium AB1]
MKIILSTRIGCFSLLCVVRDLEIELNMKVYSFPSGNNDLYKNDENMITINNIYQLYNNLMDMGDINYTEIYIDNVLYIVGHSKNICAKIMNKITLMLQDGYQKHIITFVEKEKINYGSQTSKNSLTFFELCFLKEKVLFFL